jgi:hypothetical protein
MAEREGIGKDIGKAARPRGSPSIESEQQASTLGEATLPISFRSVLDAIPRSPLQYNQARESDPTSPEAIALRYGVSPEALERLQIGFVCDELNAKWINTFNSVPAFREIMEERAAARTDSENGPRRHAHHELDYDAPRLQRYEVIARECGIDEPIIDALREATLKHLGREIFGPGYELRAESYGAEMLRKVKEWVAENQKKYPSQ